VRPSVQAPVPLRKERKGRRKEGRKEGGREGERKGGRKERKKESALDNGEKSDPGLFPVFTGLTVQL
jgi:hypothetical protein